MASGISIIIRKQLALHVHSCKSYKGRIIYVNLFFKGKTKIRIIQFYNYADLKHKNENLLLYDELFKYILEAQKLQYYIIVMGDFNVKPEEIT